MSKDNSGTEAELVVDVIARHYQKQRILRLKKVGPPSRWVFLQGRMQCILTKSPFVDYHGCWTERGARMLCCEVKSTEEPKLPISTDTGLKTSQVDAMVDWSAMGAACFVLWMHEQELRFITIVVIRLIMRHRLHLKWEDCESIPPLHFLEQGWDFVQPLRGAFPH